MAIGCRGRIITLRAVLGAGRRPPIRSLLPPPPSRSRGRRARRVAPPSSERLTSRRGSGASRRPPPSDPVAPVALGFHDRRERLKHIRKTWQLRVTTSDEEYIFSSHEIMNLAFSPLVGKNSEQSVEGGVLALGDVMPSTIILLIQLMIFEESWERKLGRCFVRTDFSFLLFTVREVSVAVLPIRWHLLVL